MESLHPYFPSGTPREMSVRRQGVAKTAQILLGAKPACGAELCRNQRPLPTYKLKQVQGSRAGVEKEVELFPAAAHSWIARGNQGAAS